MYNVMDVARFVVNYSIDIGKPVSNLKLQKLLYYIQAAFIKQTGEPCYGEPIMHWRHGPVVEDVYQKYKVYGAENITDKELEYYFVYFDIDDMMFKGEWKKYDENIFSVSDLWRMKAVIDKYQETSPWEMVELTHKEEPWKKTEINCEITLDLLKQYYC